MQKQTYEVTEKAGLFVAGKRSPGAGKPIQLTEEQAHFALAAGELRAPGPKPAEEANKEASSEEQTKEGQAVATPSKAARKG